MSKRKPYTLCEVYKCTDCGELHKEEVEALTCCVDGDGDGDYFAYWCNDCGFLATNREDFDLHDCDEVFRRKRK